MENTKDRIIELETILKKYNAPLLRYLNPGIKKEEILIFFDRNRIQPNPSLVSLYEWHNGIYLSTEGLFQSVIEIMPMGIFYNLEDMIKTREDLTRWNFIQHPNEYLPLLGSGEDDLHLLSNITGQIFYFSPAVQIYGELEFRSIDAMFDCIIECYEEGIFTIDSEKGLNENYEEFEEKKKIFR